MDMMELTTYMGEEEGLIMSVDDFVIAQFGSINAFLADIHASIRETNKTMGEIGGVQRAHSESLKRVERRLDGATKYTQKMIDDLKRTTTGMEIRLQSLAPQKTKKEWLRGVLNAANVKLILLILASILAFVAGITVPIQ